MAYMLIFLLKKCDLCIHQNWLAVYWNSNNNNNNKHENKQNKRQKDCLWKQRAHYGLKNGSLSFIETLHRSPTWNTYHKFAYGILMVESQVPFQTTI